MLNITFKDSVIGDDLGSSPWAIKLKTDSQEGGVVDGIYFINLTIGNSTCTTNFPTCCPVVVAATVRACST